MKKGNWQAKLSDNVKRQMSNKTAYQYYLNLHFDLHQ